MYLSVITVSCNDVEGLKRTAESVLPLPDNCEWIIIDAASTDDTREFLEALPESDAITWQSEPDKGIYDGMNKGIVLSSGEYLCFMNAGDSFVREAFLSICEKQPRSAHVIMHDCSTRYENGEAGHARQFPKSIDEIREWACIQHQSTLISKDVFHLLGNYDLTYKYLADYEHGVRAYLHNHITFKLDGDVKLACFALGGVSSRLNTAARVMDEYMMIQKKYFGTFSKKLYVVSRVKQLLLCVPAGDRVYSFFRTLFLKQR